MFSCFRGFSYIDLVEDTRTKMLFALKRMLCHSKRDENISLAEVRFMTQFHHPNLIPCEVHALKKLSSQSASGAESEVLLVMPYYKVRNFSNETNIFTCSP